MERINDPIIDAKHSDSCSVRARDGVSFLSFGVNLQDGTPPIRTATIVMSYKSMLELRDMLTLTLGQLSKKTDQGLNNNKS